MPKPINIYDLESKAARIAETARKLNVSLSSLGGCYFDLLGEDTAAAVFKDLFDKAKLKKQIADETAQKLSELAFEFEDDLHEVVETFGISQTHEENRKETEK